METKEYLIPTKLKEITFGEYVRLLRAMEETKDDEDIFRNLIKVYIPEKHIRNMPVIDIERIGLSLLKMLQEKPKLQKVIKLNGKELYFHSELIKITAGEEVDILSYQQDGLFKNLDKILAVLYRPAKIITSYSYELEDYTGTEDRPELIAKYMSAEVAAGAYVFFWNLMKLYLQDTEESLKNQHKQG